MLASTNLKQLPSRQLKTAYDSLKKRFGAYLSKLEAVNPQNSLKQLKATALLECNPQESLKQFENR